LEADATRVVGDALADQTEVGRGALGAVAELDHARLVRRAAVHPERAPAAHLLESGLVEDLDLEPVRRGEALGELAEGRGVEQRAGSVREVARDRGGPGERPAALRPRTQALEVLGGSEDRERLEARDVRGGAPRLVPVPAQDGTLDDRLARDRGLEPAKVRRQLDRDGRLVLREAREGTRGVA